MQSDKRRTLTWIIAGALAAGLWGCGGDETGTPEAETAQRRELTRDQKKQFEQLSIRQIMQGPGFVGTAPSDPVLSANGGTVYFQWNSPEQLDSLNAINPLDGYAHWRELEPEAGAWALDVAGGEIRELSAATADSLVPEESFWNRRLKRRAEIRAGDLYLADAGNDGRRITGTLSREHSVRISSDGETVYFVREDNVFSVGWHGGPAQQLTDIRSGDDPDLSDPSEQRQYLLDQQQELFDEFNEPEEAPTRGPQPLYLGDGWGVDDAHVSPSGRYVALSLSKEASGTRAPRVPLAVTESGYLETEETRPKVGEAQDETRVDVIDLEGDSLMVVEAEEDWWASVRAWAPEDDLLLVRAISPDWHDRVFAVVDPGRKTDAGKLAPREMDRYHDDAWVGGPGFYRTGGWLPDGGGIWFVSEADGWGRLYSVLLSGRRVTLTPSGVEVHYAWTDPDRACFYFVSNEGLPGSRRLWRMNLDGTDRRLLTPQAGEYEVSWSPDMSRAAVLHSTVDQPEELYLFDTAGDELRGPFTRSTTEAFRGFGWLAPQVVTFEASDGAPVRAHLFDPSDFGARRNGAGVIFIHGAGYLQNVIDSWGYYYREYMFNHFLASRGYTVLNVDFRASAGYGRASRVAIHKHMGGRDLNDIIDAARYLKDKHGVGEHQVGVYGGSYGGFLTLMALFKYDEIRSGAALRSVTDWAHYNHWYTSRILGLPTEDDEAYRRSSPIYFAEGLEGDLLMLHGLRDNNVLANDVLRLSQRLIELGKENWELALHPVEGHAYQRAASWTDQMTRAFKLFERTLPDGAPGKVD